MSGAIQGLPLLDLGPSGVRKQEASQRGIRLLETRAWLTSPRTG